MQLHDIFVVNIRTEQWPNSDGEHLKKCIATIQSAKAECIEDLGNAKKSMKKARPQDIERWKELAEKPLEFIRNTFSGARLATQFSKVLEQSTNTTAVVQPGVARAKLIGLSTGGEQAKTALESLGTQHWLTWAPEHKDALLRLLNSLEEYIKVHATGPTITLLVPFLRPPACDTYREIADV